MGKKNQVFQAHVSNIETICFKKGLFLTDLTFIHEGNKDYLENGHVNYNKCRLVAQIILQIKKYQKKPYNIETVKEIQDYLLNQPITTEKENYNMSLIAEPRENRS